MGAFVVLLEPVDPVGEVREQDGEPSQLGPDPDDRLLERQGTRGPLTGVATGTVWVRW